MASDPFYPFAVHAVQRAGSNDLTIGLHDRRADESQDGGFLVETFFICVRHIDDPVFSVFS